MRGAFYFMQYHATRASIVMEPGNLTETPVSLPKMWPVSTQAVTLSSSWPGLAQATQSHGCLAKYISTQCASQPGHASVLRPGHIWSSPGSVRNSDKRCTCTSTCTTYFEHRIFSWAHTRAQRHCFQASALQTLHYVFASVAASAAAAAAPAGRRCRMCVLVCGQGHNRLALLQRPQHEALGRGGLARAQGRWRRGGPSADPAGSGRPCAGSAAPPASARAANRPAVSSSLPQQGPLQGHTDTLPTDARCKVRGQATLNPGTRVLPA